MSQPLLVIINPLASIILSIWLFDERFTDSPAKITIAVLAMAVLAAGVIALSRTAPKDLTPHQTGRDVSGAHGVHLRSPGRVQQFPVRPADWRGG